MQMDNMGDHQRPDQELTATGFEHSIHAKLTELDLLLLQGCEQALEPAVEGLRADLLDLHFWSA